MGGSLDIYTFGQFFGLRRRREIFERRGREGFAKGAKEVKRKYKKEYKKFRKL
jgi:hypothetical protein